MFGDPVRIAARAVEGGCEGGCGTEVCYGSREAILEYARWVNRWH